MTRISRLMARVATVAVMSGTGLIHEVSAQSADSSVVLTVSLDHDDWLYRVGESAVFNVSLQRAGQEVPNTSILISIAQERMKPMRVDTIAGLVKGTTRRHPSRHRNSRHSGGS